MKGLEWPTLLNARTYGKVDSIIRTTDDGQRMGKKRTTDDGQTDRKTFIWKASLSCQKMNKIGLLFTELFTS